MSAGLVTSETVGDATGITGDTVSIGAENGCCDVSWSTQKCDSGPRVDPVAFIRLALIKKENINAEKVEK